MAERKKTPLRVLYEYVCKGEQYLAAALFITIVALVFISALTRKMGFPIQWTMDITKICFAWLSFISGDIALRNGALPSMDMLVKKLPDKLQLIIKYMVWLMMLALLVFFVYFGLKLASSNSKRQFQTLAVSYSVVSMSLPVCALCMCFSVMYSIVNDVKSRWENRRGK
ncbi:MAG: TRAP transporter small permease [Spirochaetaceae bacterium]|nr:TRAP transporter small permease [Spirochaetaceae bacterium]